MLLAMLSALPLWVEEDCQEYIAVVGRIVGRSPSEPSTSLRAREETVLTSSKLPLRRRQETQCRLLSLPAELRNRIYEYAVVLDCAILIIRQSSIFVADPSGRTMYAPTSRVSSAARQPGLTRTCRLCRSECLGLFYCSNDFQMGAVGKLSTVRMPTGQEYVDNVVETLARWLEAMGEGNRKSMRAFDVLDDRKPTDYERRSSIFQTFEQKISACITYVAFGPVEAEKMTGCRVYLDL